MGSALFIITFFATLLVPPSVCVAKCPRVAKGKHNDDPDDKEGPKKNNGHHHRRSQNDEGDGGDGSIPPNNTVIRLYVGSHENHHNKIAGSVPGVVLFDDAGQRLGEFESKSENLIAGGYRDIAIPMSSTPGHENTMPSYIHLVAGKEDICISAVVIALPDGTQQGFSGDELRYCENVAKLSASRTLVGNIRPSCFWLEGQKHFRTTMGGLSVHLPDFTRSAKKRLASYVKNSTLACAQSPRLHSYYGKEQRTIKHSIYIFNPPLEYDEHTELDKDPSRILTWSYQKHSFEDRSDQPANRLAYRAIAAEGDSGNGNTTTATTNSTTTTTTANNATETTGTNNPTNDKPTNADDTLTHTTTESTTYITVTEESRTRTQPPALLISDGEVSAQSQCLYAPWTHVDYLSLSERLFCDMQSRTLVPLCDAVVVNTDRSTTCFNDQTYALQTTSDLVSSSRLAVLGHFGSAAGSLARAQTQNSWTPTGPMFGYRYTDVSYAY